MKKELIPVILAKNPADFKNKLAVIKTLRPMPRWVQIDVVDGKFAPWKTWPRNPLQLPLNLRGRDCCVEVDLMVVDPLKHAKAWIKAGAKRVLIHAETLSQYTEAELPSRWKLGFLSPIKIGLSLNAKTSIKVLESYLTTRRSAALYVPPGRGTRPRATLSVVDCVLLLGVDPGKSGQPFQPQVLKKIRALRKKFPTLPIEVDGGVNLKNAEQILKAGATRLAVASAILQAPDPQKAYRQFLRVVQYFQNL